MKKFLYLIISIILMFGIASTLSACSSTECECGAPTQGPQGSTGPQGPSGENVGPYHWLREVPDYEITFIPSQNIFDIGYEYLRSQLMIGKYIRVTFNISFMRRLQTAHPFPSNIVELRGNTALTATNRTRVSFEAFAVNAYHWDFDKQVGETVTIEGFVWGHGASGGLDVHGHFSGQTLRMYPAIIIR